MKNLTNILSYLWLLLLMAVTACSDLEEEVGPMRGDEEVELTIPVEIPGMKAATRTVPTENITQITAIAFDENGAYIKTRQAVLNRTEDNSGNSTRGTLRIKVPSKTRSIHFLAKNNANDAFSGIQSLDNLKYNTQTWELHYWGFLSFTSTTELKAFNRFLTLYRNQAMITLEAGNDDYIAGFVNYNTSGTMVPYSNEHGFGFRIASQNGVVYQTIPNGVSKQTDGINNLGKAHYLFEHENNKNNRPLYAVCNIGSKFYKVAFARTINNNLTYFPIIRNHEYKIVVDPTQINTAYGFDNYDGAKDSPSPINDVVITTVDLSLNPTTQDLIINADGEKKCTVTVTVPQGITNLKVSAPKDANSVEVFTITPPNGLTTNAEGEYIVNPNQQYTFTFTLADNYDTTGTATIEFSGSGSYYKTNKASATIYLKKNGQLTVNPTTATIDNTAGTTQTISVTILQNMNINKLQISADAFEVSSNNGLSLQNGYYNVSPNNTYSFTFTLKQEYDNSTGDQTIEFTGTSDHWTATGTSTITLREPTEVREVTIFAEPYTRSLNYTTNANSVSDLIVNVTIPAGVTTLNFESEYFDLISVNGRTKTENEVSTPYITGSGPYTVDHQSVGELTLPFRLRLKSEKKAPTSSAGYTFGGSGEGVTVTPATISNITLTESGDEYVRWQGDVLLDWGNEGAVTQIPLPYSWFEGIAVDSKLRVDYQVTDADKSEKDRDAVIQFTEVKGDSWTDSPYDFAELKENDGEDAGVNLSKDTKSGSIYDRGGVIELILTQTILEKMVQNKTTFDGLENIVMAIQGGNVRLKKISVIPAGAQGGGTDNNNQLDMTLAFSTDNGAQLNNMIFGISTLNLTATISQDDANNSNLVGQTVTLQGAFTKGNSHEQAVNWPQSFVGDEITSDDGRNLQFTIQSGVTSYSAKWVFIRTDDGAKGDASITYALSNSQGYTLDGETSVDLVIKNSAQVQGEKTFTDWNDPYSLSEFFPAGTTITVVFADNESDGSTIKFCDGSGQNMLYLTDDNTGYSNDNANLYINFSGSRTFVIHVNENTKLYGNGNGNDNGNLSNGLSGLRIESGNAVLQSVTVAAPPSALNRPNQ